MTRTSPLLLAAGILACHLPGLELFTSYEPEGTISTSGPFDMSTGGVLPTTTADTLSSSTQALEPNLDLGGGTTDGNTTAEPVPPPAIVEPVTLTPTPLTKLGTIGVAAVAQNAFGVRMRVDDGDAIDLAGGPDAYDGGIPFYTGLSSGPHSATFVAWRDDLQSEPVVVPFEVDLPPPGEDYGWESADLFGNGNVAAVAALPMADSEAPVMVEWGTFYKNGQARCFLRRRDALGLWGGADFVEVLPNFLCVATDIQVAPDGTLYLLATRITDAKPRWWLGRVKTWATATTPENVSSGDADDVGNALALSGEKLAVCGTRPLDKNDPFDDEIDAAVWVVGEPVRTFDYYDDPKILKHTMGETLNDCVIDGETLVAVGDARGPHINPWDPPRRRHLQLRLDLGTKTFTPHVGAELGQATQSTANAVALGDAGLVVTVGYLCGDVCEPDAALWGHWPDGGLDWYTPLGADLGAPRAVTRSPAGYFVLAGSQQTGQGSRFWMGAYFIKKYEPVWTYVHGGVAELEFANTVAVSAAGHIYGGGVGVGGFPAVVYIRP